MTSKITPHRPKFDDEDDSFVSQASAMVPANLRAKATPQLKQYLLNSVGEIFKRREVINKAKEEERKKQVLKDYLTMIKFDSMLGDIKKAKEAQEKEYAKAAELEKKAHDIRDKANEKLIEAETALMVRGVTSDGAPIKITQVVNGRFKDSYGSTYDIGRRGYEGRWFLSDRLKPTPPPRKVNQREIDEGYGPEEMVTVRMEFQDRLIEVPDDVAQKILQVEKLLEAVKEEVVTIKPGEVLNIRMMMANTVAECIAIINAVAGYDAFGFGEQINEILCVESGAAKIALEDRKEEKKK